MSWCLGLEGEGPVSVLDTIIILGSDEGLELRQGSGGWFAFVLRAVSSSPGARGSLLDCCPISTVWTHISSWSSQCLSLMLSAFLMGAQEAAH